MELLEAIAALRAELGEDKSHMEVVRHVLQNELNRKGKVDLSMLLSAEERTLLDANLAKAESFLDTEDGADAWALLVAAFEQHVK